MEFPCTSSPSPPPPSAESILPKVHFFFFPSKHMAGRENWKWAVPALDRCFFRCSRVTYSNCSRCLALGERGRREGRAPRARGFPPLPGARVLPRHCQCLPPLFSQHSSSSPGTGGHIPAGFGGAGAPLTRGYRGEPGAERQHPAAGTGRFKAVPAPCLPEAPYGLSCTSAALFPHQLGPEGELREQQPPPTPQPPGAPALGITRGLRG